MKSIFFTEPVAPVLLHLQDITAMNMYWSIMYTAVKRGGATPTETLSKGPMINQYMGVAPPTFQLVWIHDNPPTWNYIACKQHISLLVYIIQLYEWDGAWQKKIFISTCTNLIGSSKRCQPFFFVATVTLHRQNHVKGGLVVCKNSTDLGHLLQSWWKKSCTSQDAPNVGFSPLSTLFGASQVVQEFFHQAYACIKNNAQINIYTHTSIPIMCIYIFTVQISQSYGTYTNTNLYIYIRIYT